MGRFSSKMTPEVRGHINSYENWLDSGSTPDRDWFSKENRVELFNRYFKWRVMTNDLDHTHYMNVLCSDYDYERKAWFAFLFGMTYRTPQAFAYAELFPYATELDMKALDDWHSKNWKRTTYGTDARYNKGHWVAQVQSVLNWLGGKTFQQKIESITVFPTEKENFFALYSEVQSLFKFGRMTAWLTMQALHDLLHLKIDPGQILIDGYSPNNDSSLQSIWNGLCFLSRNESKLVGSYGDHKCSQKDVDWGREALMEYTRAAEIYSGFEVDSFRLESIYCQWKRLWGSDGSKEYPGHASGDAASRYLYYRNEWKEIDWSKFRLALRTQPGLVKGRTFVDWHNSVFGKTGLMMNMHELFPDMINAYKVLSYDPNKDLIREVWEDDNLPVPKISSDQSTFHDDTRSGQYLYAKKI